MRRRELIKSLALGTAGLAAAPVHAVAERRGGEGTVDERETDVFVAGGSMTGVFAAMRAAEAGKRVVLVERRGAFGGTATQGLVPVLHSIYSTDAKVLKKLADDFELPAIVLHYRELAKIKSTYIDALPFTDVEAGSYYETAVRWAVEMGITTGVDETHFAPDLEISRAQTVTFLWRYAGSPA